MRKDSSTGAFIGNVESRNSLSQKLVKEKLLVPL